jgi:hypothetical protein
MFLGHFGVALAAKKVAPRTSLGVLLLAAQFADLLWPIFCCWDGSRCGSRRELRGLLLSTSFHILTHIVWWHS